MRVRKGEAIRLAAAVAFWLLAAGIGSSAAADDSASVNTADLDRDVRRFLDREIAAHVAYIKTLDPPPDRVVGALTTGEFSWGSFMRALGAYSEFTGTKTIAGHDVAQMIGKMAQIELSHGGKTWAQPCLIPADFMMQRLIL
jgi:hypothetical protein